MLLVKDRLSLNLKIIIPIVFVAAFLGILITHHNYSNAIYALQEHIEERSMQLVHVIAHVSQIENEPQELQRFIYSLGAEKDIRSILIVGNQPMRILQCNIDTWIDTDLDDLPNNTLKHLIHKALINVREQRKLDWTHSVFTYVMPFKIPSQSEGVMQPPQQVALAIEMDIRSLKKEELYSYIFNTTVGITSILILVITTYTLVRRKIIQPLETIRNTMEARKQGDLKAFSPVVSDDIIGTLSRTFNAMIRVQMETDSLFQKLADTVPVLIWMSSTNRRLDYFNKRWIELTCMTLKRLLDGNLIAVVHPEDYRNLLKTYLSAFDEKQAFYSEFRLKNNTGGYNWFLNQAAPYYLADGSFAGYIGCCIDITWRKNTEKDLAEKTSQLENFAQNLKTLHIASTSEHTHLDILYHEYLRIGCNLLNISTGVFRRIDNNQLIVVSSISPFPEVGIDSIRPLNTWLGCDVLSDKAIWDHTTISNFKENPHVIKYHVTRYLVAPVVVNGAIYGALEFAETKDDTAPFSTYEQEIIKLISRGLSHFIEQDILQKERQEAQEALELYAKELAHARDEALQSTKIKSDFLATMSHEIRTPMNGVIGFSNLIRNTDLNTEQLECVQGIESSAKILLELINQILDLSKIEAGRIELEATSINLIGCIEEIIDLFYPVIIEKGLDFSVCIQAHVPEFIIGDAVRIRQIFINLLSNAIKFTKKGFIKIFVDATVETNTYFSSGYQWQILVTVSDTGIGISPEKQSKIFEPFLQADSSTTRKFGGTGLGLSIAKSLITLMGGSIEVTSQQEVGSQFKFSFCADTLPNCSDENIYTFLYKSLNSNPIYLISADESEIAYFKEISIRGHFKLIHATNFDYMYTQKATICIIDLGLFNDVIIELPQSHTYIAYGTIEELSKSRNLFDVKFNYKILKPIRLEHLLTTLIQAQKQLVPQFSNTTVNDNQNYSILAKNIKIVLAEDNLVNQTILKKLFTFYEIDISIVSNGKELLKILKEHLFDIILMDVNMPEMDGHEATRRVRAGDSGINAATIPILGITAFAMKSDYKQHLDCGMNAYISKPIQASELLNLIYKLTHK